VVGRGTQRGLARSLPAEARDGPCDIGPERTRGAIAPTRGPFERRVAQRLVAQPPAPGNKASRRAYPPRQGRHRVDYALCTGVHDEEITAVTVVFAAIVSAARPRDATDLIAADGLRF
jgi:hypothetical protein